MTRRTWPRASAPAIAHAVARRRQHPAVPTPGVAHAVTVLTTVGLVVGPVLEAANDNAKYYCTLRNLSAESI